MVLLSDDGRVATSFSIALLTSVENDAMKHALPFLNMIENQLNGKQPQDLFNMMFSYKQPPNRINGLGKRGLALAACAVLCATGAHAQSSWAYTTPGNGRLTPSPAITGFDRFTPVSNTGGDLTIDGIAFASNEAGMSPCSMNLNAPVTAGYQIIGIGTAFQNRSWLEGIILPSTLTSLPANALTGNANLEFVEFTGPPPTNMSPTAYGNSTPVTIIPAAYKTEWDAWLATPDGQAFLALNPVEGYGFDVDFIDTLKIIYCL